MRNLGWLLLLGSLLVQPALCEDWPHYKGPQRNDLSTETGLLKQWPEEGPKLAWTYRNTGVGLSGPAVVGDRLYTLGGRGETEYLIALDLSSAENQSVKEVWATPVGPLLDWRGNNWSTGPSATPTVDGNLIFALGGMGHLVCVEAETGKPRWTIDLPKELQAEINPIGGGPKKLGWGFTWSPLVDDDKLICMPGGPAGTVAALEKQTGKVLWRSTELTDQAAYTSPVLATLGGVRQYVVLTNQGVHGVEAERGGLLWSYLRTPRYSTEVINSPIVSGEFVYVTVGAGQGCDLIRVRKPAETFLVERVYANKNMANHHGNVVALGPHVYGFSQGRGWVCQEFATGDIVWMERRKLRAGAMVYADGHFYCYGEDNGEVVLIRADSEGWNESGRFLIPEQSELRKPKGKIWTPPVVAGGRLFLRDQELLFCYDVRDRK